ncbi:MAG TPA: DUF2520 domain-containing protein [Candidatus Acidoferrum sp.]|nr:DUF2520 domain-containing protein [Candidatus Acidoferrum sp.]
MPNSLAIIGAGRVGRALGRRLRELGWKIGAVVTRNAVTARKAVRFIGAGRAHAASVRDVLASRVILVSVPDDAVVEVAGELARIGAEELRGKIVLHTSGALDGTALGALKEYGAAVGGMHPLQTFSGVGVPPLEGKIFAIEGDAAAVRAARQMVRSLGGSPVRIAGNKKMLYHAAAAMAAGHVLAVEEAATQLLISIGMTRSQAVRALLPLTRQVLENFERLGPRAAWTGPLSRGDYRIVESHWKALQESPPELAAAYAALNRLAARVLAQDAVGMLADLANISVEKKAKIVGGNA